MARNWLQPTVAVMRLHAYLTQALLPLPPSPMHDAERKLQKYAQLPGIKEEDVRGLGVSGENIGEVIGVLQSRNDERIADIKKAIGRWGKVEIVDAQFQGSSGDAHNNSQASDILYLSCSPWRTYRHSFGPRKPPRQAPPLTTDRRDRAQRVDLD